MNITRRGFLKLLGAIPIVAALPKTVELLAAVPEEVIPAPAPVELSSSWLRINGAAVNAVRMSVTGYSDVVDTSSLGAYAHKLFPGVLRRELEAKILWTPECAAIRTAFYDGDPALIEANLGGVMFRGRGRFTDFAISDEIGGMMTADLAMAIFDAEYVAG